MKIREDGFVHFDTGGGVPLVLDTAGGPFRTSGGLPAFIGSVNPALPTDSGGPARDAAVWDDQAYLNWYQSLPEYVKSTVTVGPTGALMLGGMAATPELFAPDFSLLPTQPAPAPAPDAVDLVTGAPTTTTPVEPTLDQQIQQWFAANPDATGQEVFDLMQAGGVDPKDVIRAMGFDPASAMAQYDAFLNPDNAPGTETPPLGSGVFTQVQDFLNTAGRKVGTGLDRIFQVLGLPPPDFTVVNPNNPSVTGTWGTPSGSVFGRIGTTPSGNVVGVQTGIPILDTIIGKVADILTGRASAGEVLSEVDLGTVLRETAGQVLGVDLGETDIVAAVIQASGLSEEDKNKILVDLGKGTDPNTVTIKDQVPLPSTGAGVDQVPASVVPPKINVPLKPVVPLEPVVPPKTIDPIFTEDINPDILFTGDELFTKGDEVLEVPGGDGGDGGGGGGGGGGVGAPVAPTAQGGIRSMATEKVGVADIGTPYDLRSSLLENMMRILSGESSDSEYSEGGSVGRYNTTDEIIELLRG